MEKDARFASCASLAAFALCGLAACATPARELPPDLSALPPAQRLLPGDVASAEYGLSCDGLATELSAMRQQASDLQARLRGTQSDNQGKAIAGLIVFTPIMLGMDDSTEAKQALAMLETRQERIVRIAQARGCRAGQTPSAASPRQAG